MRRLLLSLLAAAALAAACASPSAETQEASIVAWAKQRHGDALRGPVQVFYGDFTGDGVADALVWMMYNDGGLRSFPDVALFRSERGQLRFWRMDETVVGSSPRDIIIAPGRIELTTTVPQDGDPGCCPSGSQRWTIVTD